MIETLQTDPYSYLKYNNVFLAVELYMPFVLVYTIDGYNVLIISAIRRDVGCILPLGL